MPLSAGDTRGTGLQRIIEQPVQEIRGVSPDGQWLVAFSSALFAYPKGGGAALRIYGLDSQMKWSPDGRFLFFSHVNLLRIGGHKPTHQH